MLTKTIKYKDFNGQDKVKNFYFNLSKSELAEMDLVEKAGIEQTIKKMINEDDRENIVKLFKKLVLRAYGVKSADGERFEKSDELRAAFEQHPAYDVLFMELISSEKAMSDFINAVVPSEVSEAAAKNKKSIDEIMGYDSVLGDNEEKKDAEVVPFENK